MDTGRDSLGAPMLFQMIEAAREWVQGHPTEGDRASRDVSPVASNNASVCKFFKQGKCKFGDKCKFAHPVKGHSPAMSEGSDRCSPGPDQRSPSRQKTEGSKNGSKPEEKNDSKSKPPSTQEPEESEKKTSMRQASDVISRILWDGDLLTEEFSIGYLDRFVGIIEKPFAAFSWEDIASVGPSVLSVPRHRIQYFKYRDQIVWDKRSQMDNFFGSRGGSTIDEIIEATAASGVEAFTKQQEDPDLELSTHKPQKYSDKDRPTHFLCIQVSNEEAVVNIQTVQDHIIKVSPQLAEGLVSPTAFHITLCMVRLENDQHIAKARTALESMTPHILHMLPRCAYLHMNGVDNFKDRLIYVMVAPNAALTKLVALLLERLQAAGVLTPGNHNEYTPHVTIVKMSRPMQRELTARIAGQALYSKFQDSNIGMQQIQAIDLCSLTAPKQEDGFFLRLHTVTNSLVHLMPEITPPLVQTIKNLQRQGKISGEEMASLEKAVTVSASPSPNEKKFEQALKILTSSDLTGVKAAKQTTVIILRGVPGSGKSFLATGSSEYLSDPSQFTICSADEYFLKDGTYKFIPEQVPEAHAHCLHKFLRSLLQSSIVVVDNTNSQMWEYQIYCYLCEVLHLDVHIIEIPCETDFIAEKFRRRNVHSVDSSALQSAMQRWQKDDRAVLVTPKLAYPTSLSSRPTFSLETLIQPERVQVQLLESLPSLFAVYTGIFLTTESQWLLVSTFPPAFPNVYADHVTLCFKPTSESISATKIGQKVKVRVTSHESGNGIQAIRVQVPSGVHFDAEYPHVTISTDNSASPKMSGAVLSKPQKSTQSVKSLVLEGTVGILVRQLLESDKVSDQEASENDPPKNGEVDFGKLPTCTVTSKKTFQQKVAKKLYPSLALSEEASIFSGTEEVTELYLFDFDGTLFHSPYPEEGKALYEERTGKKWPHKGWWSCPESLLPPLVVYPGPSIADFHSYLGRAGSKTFVLTSRIDRTRGPLKEILEHASVFPDRIITKPDDSKEMLGYTFKGIAVKNLLSEFPSVTTVKFWDDKQENLDEVERIVKLTKKDVQLDLIYVEPPTSLQLDVAEESLVGSKNSPISTYLEASLSTYSNMPSDSYSQAANAGVQFLAQQFAQIVDFEDDSNLLAYPFGSFPLGRSSDVDLCLVAPPTNTPIEFAEKLATRLEQCGLKFIHVGRSSRCPRLKVCIYFNKTGAIDYDIVFAILNDSAVLQHLENLTVPDIQAKLKRGHAASKAAFTGPVFLHHVREAVRGAVSSTTFAAVVEMVVQILRANRLKGNAFHCIRTFHVIQLLADFIKSTSKNLPTSNWNADSLFKDFVTSCSRLPSSKWKKLFGEFVPQHYISKIISAFTFMCSQVEASGFPLVAAYRALRTTAPIPFPSYTTVKVMVTTSDSILLWKIESLIEAKLPAYIRKLIDSGIDVVPYVVTADETTCAFSFAISETANNVETTQQVFRPFWNEVSEFRQNRSVSIELLFKNHGESRAVTNVDASHQKYADLVNSFCHSDETECHLSSDLSSYERRLVHEAAERMSVHHETVHQDGAAHIVLRKQDSK